MCLAIFKPASKAFDYKKIETAWENNPHGAGVAVRDNGAVTIAKGFMTLSELTDFLKTNESFLRSRDVVLHLRWSTSGKIIPELTHPFPISHSLKKIMSLDCITDRAIIHNGVMFSPRTNSFSDTAIFSRLFAFGDGLNEAQILSVIGDDRLAIVSGDGVKMIGEWHMIEDCFYSNLYSLNSNKWDKWDEKFFSAANSIYKCPICESDEVEKIGVYSNAHECLECHAVFNHTEYFMDDSKPVAEKYSDDDLNDPFYFSTKKWG